jgi:hypothetical protein
MNSYTADGTTAPTNGIYFVAEAAQRITNLVTADTLRGQPLPSEADWTKWPYAVLAAYLQDKFPEDRAKQEAPLAAYMEANPPPLNSDEKSDERRYALIAEFETRAKDLGSDEEYDLVETCVRHMRKFSQAESSAFRNSMLKGCSGDGAPETFSMLNARITANREDFLERQKGIRNDYGCELVSTGPAVGKNIPRDDRNKTGRNNSGETSGGGGGGDKKKAAPFVPTTGEICEACGNKGHKPEACAFIVGGTPMPTRRTAPPNGLTPGRARSG